MHFLCLSHVLLHIVKALGYQTHHPIVSKLYICLTASLFRDLEPNSGVIVTLWLYI